MAAMSQLSSRWGAIDMSATWRPLQEGDVFRKIDGTHHYVGYVNSSGAYVLALTSMVQGSSDFQTGGQTISANAVVQIIHPLELGGNSQEYGNYVRLSGKYGRQGMAKRGKGTADKGATLGNFEDSPLTDIEAEANAAFAASETTVKESNGMAKKAAAKKAAPAKKDKAPKTVRKCACGCTTETTGYFAPGHDARMHGWIKKLAAGTIQPGDIPKAVVKSLDLVQTKEGFRAKSPHFWKD